MKTPRHRPTITEVRIAILVGAGLLAIAISIVMLIPMSIAAHQ